MQSDTVPTGSIPEPATAEEAVMVAMVRVWKRLRHRIPGEEIDLTTMPLMKALHHNGPMRVSALACALDLDASTVSRHAKALEDRGLIERAEDPDDGRASRVTISAHGIECLEKGAAGRRALIAEALDDWSSEDRETLRVLLHRLAVDFATPTDSLTPQIQENP
jgi:DNA-binding MarR family transcriptional regulator